MEPLCEAWTLDTLRWHWGSAYEITSSGPEAWHAFRRDGRGEIHADSPRALLIGIRIDYQIAPVPRPADPGE
jgi:hypothetical protein